MGKTFRIQGQTILGQNKKVACWCQRGQSVAWHGGPVPVIGLWPPLLLLFSLRGLPLLHLPGLRVSRHIELCLNLAKY